MPDMGSILKPVDFRGRSLDELRAFPSGARLAAGFQVYQVQWGIAPDDWKPMKTIGKGVREIRLSESDGTFRVLYVANIGYKVYVLRCFQKGSQKTPPADIDAAQERYKALVKELRQ